MWTPFVIKIVKPGDARGWIGFGCFLLVLVVLSMILLDRALLESDAFLILATAIVITGWVNGPVGWAYQATKGGGDAADANARIAEAATGASVSRGSEEDPMPVHVVNEPSEPVPTESVETEPQPVEVINTEETPVQTEDVATKPPKKGK